MDVLLRCGRALCVALLIAGALAPGAVSAQSPIKGGPIDVPTVMTIPPQEEAPSATASHSSYDYEVARTASTAPWEAPRGPWNTPDTIAAATVATPAPPPGFAAFTGAALPLPCREAGYRMIIDARSDVRSGTLCYLPDGSWQFLP